MFLCLREDLYKEMGSVAQYGPLDEHSPVRFGLVNTIEPSLIVNRLCRQTWYTLQPRLRRGGETLFAIEQLWLGIGKEFER